jgi:hypothetical protein
MEARNHEEKVAMQAFSPDQRAQYARERFRVPQEHAAALK